MPSYADFSEIMDLMDVKRLYEEQQEKWNLRLHEKEEQLQQILQDVEWRREQVQQAQGASGSDEILAQLQNEKTQIIQDAQQRLQQLNQRLAELNQRLGQG